MSSRRLRRVQGSGQCTTERRQRGPRLDEVSRWFAVTGCAIRTRRNGIPTRDVTYGRHLHPRRSCPRAPTHRSLVLPPYVSATARISGHPVRRVPGRDEHADLLPDRAACLHAGAASRSGRAPHSRARAGGELRLDAPELDEAPSFARRRAVFEVSGALEKAVEMIERVLPLRACGYRELLAPFSEGDNTFAHHESRVHSGLCVRLPRCVLERGHVE